MKYSVQTRINFLQKFADQKTYSLYSVEQWKTILKRVAGNINNSFKDSKNPPATFWERNYLTGKETQYSNCIIKYAIFDKNEFPAIVFMFPNPDVFRSCYYRAGDGLKRMSLAKNLLQEALLKENPAIPVSDFEYEFSGQISEAKVPINYDILIICQPKGIGK